MKVLPLSFAPALARKLYTGQLAQTRRPRGLFDQLQPGDHLWVREPFHLPEQFENQSPTQAVLAGSQVAWWSADGDAPPGVGRRRFARELPRAFHRSSLIVTAVRQERLCDLTDADAVLEGARDREAFSHEWNMLLGAGKYSISGGRMRWQDNPAVTVLTFDFRREPL